MADHGEGSKEFTIVVAFDDHMGPGDIAAKFGMALRDFLEAVRFDHPDENPIDVAFDLATAGFEETVEYFTLWEQSQGVDWPIEKHGERYAELSEKLLNASLMLATAASFYHVSAEIIKGGQVVEEQKPHAGRAGSKLRLVKG